jgi:hypothetical protein
MVDSSQSGKAVAMRRLVLAISLLAGLGAAGAIAYHVLNDPADACNTKNC